jgi:hypothetical protein
MADTQERQDRMGGVGTLTRDERERLLILTTSGTVSLPERWETEHRLMFARDLFEHGRIGRKDVEPLEDMPTDAELDAYTREREARADADLMIRRAIGIPRARRAGAGGEGGDDE